MNHTAKCLRQMFPKHSERFVPELSHCLFLFMLFAFFFFFVELENRLSVRQDDFLTSNREALL